MKRARARRREQMESAMSIDMAPLIDMVFILLIFFMVTASFTREAAVSIERPSSSQAQSVGKSDYLALTISRDGDVYAGATRIDGDDASAIRSALQGARTTRAVVIPDQQAPAGLLLRVMDAARAAGAEDVRVAATKR